MSLETIRNIILKASESEASRIIDAAKKQAKMHLETRKKHLLEDNERAFQIKARIIEEESSRKLISYQGLASKKLLEKRNACLHTIFSSARSAILKWDEKEYREVMKGLVDRTTNDKKGKIRVHKEEVSLFLLIMEELCSNRTPERSLSLDMDNPLKIRGGFIFVTEDFEVDCTLDTIFTDIEKELLPVIAKDLFENGP